MKALIYTVMIQFGFLLAFFVGGLLDPLIDLWLCLFYFIIPGTFFTYKYFIKQDKI